MLIRKRSWNVLLLYNNSCFLVLRGTEVYGYDDWEQIMPRVSSLLLNNYQPGKVSL